MSNCAVVRLEDSQVINIIVADPSDPPPMGCILVEMTPENYGGAGWTWNGTKFIDPSVSGDPSGGG